MNTLKLTLKQHWFNLMLSGEKTKEYREPSKWIGSRLYSWQNKPKPITKIRFTNGYGATRPWFECECLGFELTTLKENLSFTTGHNLELNGRFYVIRLGKMLDSGNLKHP